MEIGDFIPSTDLICNRNGMGVPGHTGRESRWDSPGDKSEILLLMSKTKFENQRLRSRFLESVHAGFTGTELTTAKPCGLRYLTPGLHCPPHWPSGLTNPLTKPEAESQPQTLTENVFKTFFFFFKHSL